MTESRGFCRNKAQEDDLRAHGLPPRAIFMDERGAESLEHCIASFRGRPGTLFIAQDLRVLGASKRQVSDIMAQMEKAGIKVVDISHPEDTTVAELVQRANVAIAGARFAGDRKRARKQGRAGGKQKGLAAWRQRDDAAPRWLVDRIVDHAGVPWRIKVQLLKPHFGESTLRRNYGARAGNQV